MKLYLTLSRYLNASVTSSFFYIVIACLAFLSVPTSANSNIKSNDFEKISIFSDDSNEPIYPFNDGLLAMSNQDVNSNGNTSLESSTSEPSETATAEDNQGDAEKPSIWERFKRNVSLTWDSPTRDFYLPVNTWHNRLVYDDEDIDRYNEFPVGAGFGASRLDEDGDWHSLYVLGFSDSNYAFQPFAGYAYEKQWGRPDGWHYGLGFTAALTAREELAYIPIPLVLPLASIGYKKISIQSSYVPGSSSNGNVLFTWIRFQIN